MRVTTKGRYALRAVLQLTKLQSDKPVSIRQLSESEGISPEFLEQIFYKLRKADLIKSTRGPGGGFQLNRDPAKITLRDLFDAVDEGIRLTPCTDCAMEDGCDKIDTCPTARTWSTISDHLQTYFESISLKDIIDDKIAV